MRREYVFLHHAGYERSATSHRFLRSINGTAWASEGRPGEEGASWGTFSENHTTGLCVGKPFDGQAAGVGNGTMVALNARSVEHIQQLHALSLRLGGTDEGAPGHRPQYGQGFHSAYVRDPDGNKLAFVYYANAC